MRARRMEWVEGQGKIPLVVRARFENTFFGLGAFAGLILLVCGVYLIAKALADPLRATETAVLAGGFVLALAAFLMVFVACPRKRLELAKRDRGLSKELKQEEKHFLRS